MGLDARWLICSGAREFVAIASALVAAGASRGVVWEPAADGAPVRIAEMRAEARASWVAEIHRPVTRRLPIFWGTMTP